LCKIFTTRRFEAPITERQALRFDILVTLSVPYTDSMRHTGYWREASMPVNSLVYLDIRRAEHASQDSGVIHRQREISSATALS
jgi:hypothetical protein